MKRRRTSDPQELAPALDHLDVLLVCGSGGVGKTSVAAAVALAEAMRGRRTCVLTIDPARRLAQAMGIKKLDDRERKVKLPAGAAPGGSLHALMLDATTAFDRLVAETAPDDEARERVLSNRIYQQLARSTAGMQEYMALERLYELDRGGRYDLVVVDTPPAAHARDLLDSPTRMLGFLTGRSLRWFLKPGMKMGRFGLRAIGGARGPIIGMVEKVTGAEMLRDTTEFFEAFQGMYDAFVERIQIVERMFASPSTGFLAVTSPERESVDEAVSLQELLVERAYGFVGTVVNRVEPAAPEGPVSVADLVTDAGLAAALAERVRATQSDHLRLAKRDAARVADLDRATGGALVLTVPRLPSLVSDLDGLAALEPHLYAH